MMRAFQRTPAYRLLGRVTLLLSMGASTAGCERPAGSAGFTVRDSAGVRIADNGGGGDVPLWEMTAEPTLVIGRREGAGEYLLDRVTAAYRLPGGEYVVANGGSAEFRFYDASGNHLQSAGGRGEGPGELRVLYNVALLEGDTLVAADPAAGRLDLFSTVGQFLGRRPVNVRGLFQPPYFAEGGQLLPDGTMLLRVFESTPNFSEGTSRAPLAFLRYDPAAGTLDSLGVFRNVENFIIEFAGRPHPDIPPAARRTVDTWGGGFIYIADTERYEIHTFDLASGRKSLIRRDVSNPPFTSQDRDDYLETYWAYVERSRRDRAAHERWIAEVPFPDTKPPIEALRADRSGRLWVQETTEDSDDPPRWAVYSVEGRLIGETSFPRNFTPLDIGEDYVLGVWRDADDVEFVHVYGLQRSRG